MDYSKNKKLNINKSIGASIDVLFYCKNLLNKEEI
nr:MAG TPA: hypothetical protein [Caudoviricetes sp.]